jgi:hypothetical protein
MSLTFQVTVPRSTENKVQARVMCIRACTAISLDKGVGDNMKEKRKRKNLKNDMFFFFTTTRRLENLISAGRQNEYNIYIFLILA